MPVTVKPSMLAEGFYPHDTLPMDFLVVAIPRKLAKELSVEIAMKTGKGEADGMALVTPILQKGLSRIRTENKLAAKRKGKK